MFGKLNEVRQGDYAHFMIVKRYNLLVADNFECTICDQTNELVFSRACLSPVRVFKYNVGVGLYLSVFIGVYAWVCALVSAGLRMCAFVSVGLGMGVCM